MQLQHLNAWNSVHQYNSLKASQIVRSVFSRTKFLLHLNIYPVMHACIVNPQLTRTVCDVKRWKRNSLSPRQTLNAENRSQSVSSERPVFGKLLLKAETKGLRFYQFQMKRKLPCWAKPTVECHEFPSCSEKLLSARLQRRMSQTIWSPKI